MSEEIKNEEKKLFSKPEVAYSLYAQAEQQLIKAIATNADDISQLTTKLQQAQADRIALNAQQALIKKVNDKIAELAAANE